MTIWALGEDADMAKLLVEMNDGSVTIRGERLTR
jgi:hypothetical protein